MITYAIGDVHGCIVELRELLELIEADAAGEDRRLVFTGDLIDRGPDSMAVVRLILGLKSDDDAGRIVVIKGNHEDMMSGPYDRMTWYMNGGNTTVESYYGFDDEFSAHAMLFRSLPLSFDDGLRFFTHAGIADGVPLDAQRDDTLLWGRNPHGLKTDPGRLVVHGHTPVNEPLLREFDLNIDTGCVYGRKLTAAKFNDVDRPPISFLSVNAKERYSI